MNRKIISTSFVLFPRKILLSYLVLTLFMFTVSPWEWRINNELYFYSLNFLYLIAFYQGYKLGVIKYKSVAKSVQFDLKKYINISLIIGLLFIYPQFLFKLKLPSAGFSEIINAISVGFLSPSLAYAAKHQAEYAGFLTLSNPLVLLYFITLPINYFVIPLGLYFWKILIPWQKISYTIIIISSILSYIAIGTNKGVFDFIILFPVIMLVLYPKLSNWKYFLTRKLKLFSLVLLFLGLGISYFSIGNQGRTKDTFGYDSSRGEFVNRDASILKIIPNDLENTYIAIDTYLTQGYYAMGLALDLDFNFTYGLGHNNFFISLSEKILGKNSIWDKTYQVRIEEETGFSSKGKWHTAYVSMANDFTFIGVTLFVFFVGYFFAQIWIDAIKLINPYAIILSPLFFIMILYFPANNQVLGNQGSSYIFWTFFIFWYKNRGKQFNYRINGLR